MADNKKIGIGRVLLYLIILGAVSTIVGALLIPPLGEFGAVLGVIAGGFAVKYIHDDMNKPRQI